MSAKELLVDLSPGIAVCAVLGLMIYYGQPAPPPAPSLTEQQFKAFLDKQNQELQNDVCERARTDEKYWGDFCNRLKAGRPFPDYGPTSEDDFP